MRIALLLAALLLCRTATTRAADFKLPPARPVATIDLPADWKPEAIARGVQAQTVDGTVYLSVEGTADTTEMGKIIDESDAMLKTRKVALNRTTRKDNHFTFNGLPAEELVYTGRDEDGPVNVSFTFVTIRDAAVVITYWASLEGDKKHQAEVGKILASFKPVSSGAVTAPAKPWKTKTATAVAVAVVIDLARLWPKSGGIGEHFAEVFEEGSGRFSAVGVIS